LILSSESHGLSAYLEPLVNGKLHIPRGLESNGQTESLNVATAAAIFLGEFTRRRAFSSH
jgi:tRNA G18 (ribose-2'-O)-methylase SpoU